MQNSLTIKRPASTQNCLKNKSAEEFKREDFHLPRSSHAWRIFLLLVLSSTENNGKKLMLPLRRTHIADKNFFFWGERDDVRDDGSKKKFLPTHRNWICRQSNSFFVVVIIIVYTWSSKHGMNNLNDVHYSSSCTVPWLTCEECI